MPPVKHGVIRLLALLSLTACGGGNIDGHGGVIALTTVTIGNLDPSDLSVVPAGAPDAGTQIVADPWTINLIAGDYTIRLCTRGTEPQGILDPMIQVFGPAGYVGQASDDAGGMNALFVLHATNGPYTLFARAVSGAAPPQSAQGNYAIRIDPGSMPLATCPLQ